MQTRWPAVRCRGDWTGRHRNHRRRSQHRRNHRLRPPESRPTAGRRTAALARRRKRWIAAWCWQRPGRAALAGGRRERACGLVATGRRRGWARRPAPAKLGRRRETGHNQHACARPRPTRGKRCGVISSSPSRTPPDAPHIKPTIQAIGRHETHRSPGRRRPWRRATGRRKRARPIKGSLPCPATTSAVPGSMSGALKPGTQVALEKSQAHYLHNVLRLKAGDGVLAFNGNDGEWQRRSRPSGKHPTLDLHEQTARRPPRRTCITCSHRSSTSASTTWCRRRSRWACHGCSRC